MQDPKKKALVIGGTGIIGTPLVLQLVTHNEYSVHTISLEKASFPKFPESVTQHLVDRNSKAYPELVAELNFQVGYWDVVIDLIAFDEKSAQQTYSLFKDHAKHIIALSTTLVYDRSTKNEEPISETNPIACEGNFGGYVDGKVRLEKFWQNVTDANWTIFRPYHVLGKHSLLGCVPEHNRDPKIIERLKKGDPLRLCEGGRIPFNYIHPGDIAMAIYRAAGNRNTFKQAYNLANPEIILVKDYYAEIAAQVGGRLVIDEVPMREVWREMKGWEMTTLPHIYDMTKLQKDIGYTPSTPLKDGVRDAIAFPGQIQPVEQIPIHQRMNKLPRPKPIKWLLE